VPWKEQTIKKNREEFVRRALAKEKSKSALCREYGISRPTGDKWISRFLCGETMEDQSRAPFHTPNRTAADVEEAVVALRKKHPAIGAKKLKRILENQGQKAPAYSTINAILHRKGLITKEASTAATPCKRFEKAYPNEMWQVDFKGHFSMQDGKRCHPLTMIDDHSRFCICIDAKENERYFGVKESFQRVFDVYGLPETVLCDNGNPWGTAQSVGYTVFEVWLMDLGILTKHGRIRHPQTQGKEERFNGTLKRELIQHQDFKDCTHAQGQFDEYRTFYNHERPHYALNMDTPSQRYTRSKLELPKNIEEWSYGSDFRLRQIKKSGYLTFDGQGYFLSEAFGGKTIGLVESPDCPHTFWVCYRQFCIAQVDVQQRVVVAKRPFVVHLGTENL